MCLGLCLNATHTIVSSAIANNAMKPLVVLHGLESSSGNMEPFCEWLTNSFNTTVYNIEIGNGEKTSLYTPLNDQLSELCETLYAIDDLLSGFNFIGISQGGLLARGYVERCNLYPVINLITLVSPHGGEYMRLLNFDMYSDFFQKHFAVANYWRNPNNLNDYYNKCIYLPIINNEVNHSYSQQQMTNMLSLTNFVMIWSPFDYVLNPPESGKFSFFDEDLKVIPLEETSLYEADLLGLRVLNESGKLHVHETNCSHVDHRNPECYSQIYNILRNYI